MTRVIVLIASITIVASASVARSSSFGAGPARARLAAVSGQATPNDDPEFTTSSRTGPGVGPPAKHDQFATTGWRGVAFVLLALVMIGWILRARARDPKIPPDEPWPDD
jgi:hypothetical protein